MNFFDFKRRSVSELVEAILGEAWTPARKAEMEQVFKARGFELVEHEQVGDYDLALWHCNTAGPVFGLYAVSINGGQYDPGAATAQHARTPRGIIPEEAILGLLHKWVDAHGQLLISSVSERKLRRYRSLLANHFQISNFEYPGRPTDSQPSFFIQS